MRRVVATAVLALLGSTLLVASGTAQNLKRKRDLSGFGTYAVRFQAGTSTAQMRAAIASAGGTVISDLHQINAMAAASTDASFPDTLDATPTVTSVFADSNGPAAASPQSAQLRGTAPAGAAPAKSGSGASGFDPWHDQFQWDDARMDVPAPSASSGAGVTVALIDTGVATSQRETQGAVAGQSLFIPCDALARVVGKKNVSKLLQIDDCGTRDISGHGTWQASRIAGALNGFASNGIAPGAKILDQKAMADVYGFDSTWVIAALLDSCDRGANVVNMSLHEFDDPTDPDAAANYLLWVDAVSYCRAKGTVVVAAAGNDHVRIDRTDMTVGGRALSGLGIVSSGGDGIALTGPESSSPISFQGMLIAPGGVPGVVMVSATGNVTADPGANVNPGWAFPGGLRDQLAYYSNYGSRVDLAAPGGSRAFNVPDFDATAANVYTDGFGAFGATPPSSDLCSSSSTACFKAKGDAFMWIQGTSMSTAEVSGAVARLLSAHPELKGNPAGVLARLQATARRDMVNVTGPMSPSTAPPLITTWGATCPGYCHISTTSPIAFADAYGAGIVDVGSAVR
jgi:hypothetical protein